MKTPRMAQHSALFTIALSCFAVFISQNASALTVDKARISGDSVQIIGTSETPFAVIYWQFTEEVAQADSNGKFQFSSNTLPASPRCVGILSDGDVEMAVEVDNCRGEIDGFYMAPQDRALVQPGERGSIRSRCELGDFVVSATFVTTGTSNAPVDFRITHSSILTDGETGEQSWLLRGINAGDNVADMRVSARCAKVLPLKHNSGGDD